METRPLSDLHSFVWTEYHSAPAAEGSPSLNKSFFILVSHILSKNGQFYSPTAARRTPSDRQASMIKITFVDDEPRLRLAWEKLLNTQPDLKVVAVLSEVDDLDLSVAK